MKTLVVQYTPRGNESYTKKLLDMYIAEPKKTDIELLDLTRDVPDLFMPDNLNAYIQRNFMGKKLSEDALRTLAKMDKMLLQFKSADVVVLASPMYNFSLPAAVKAWFDSVIFAGETFKMGKNGFEGLMKGKKALILMASGGVYGGDNQSMDHAMSLAKLEFQFMGFDDVIGITAHGTGSAPDKMEGVLEEGRRRIKETIKKWYV